MIQSVAIRLVESLRIIPDTAVSAIENPDVAGMEIMLSHTKEKIFVAFALTGLLFPSISDTPVHDGLPGSIALIYRHLIIHRQAIEIF